MERLITATLITATCFLTIFYLSGCAGRIYVGMERTDKIHEVRTMEDKPWYCTYLDCGGNKNGK